jgi:hypothetical protein
MTKDLTLLHVDGKVLTRQSLLDGLDDVVVKLHQTGNEKEIKSALIAMDNVSSVSGIAKAKLLWHWRLWWEETKQSEKRNDKFEDMVESDIGTVPITTRRYTLTWQYIEDCLIPKEVQFRCMDDLIKITHTLDNDYDISKENWKELARASNSADVREILRKIKKQPPRKSGTQKVLTRDGSLNLYDKDGKHFVGYLEINSEDEVVQKFLRQFIQNMQIQEK